jgi:hypothetical protein
MPHGFERTAPMKKAGILRNAADSHGVVYAKRGRPITIPGYRPWGRARRQVGE